MPSARRSTSDQVRWSSPWIRHGASGSSSATTSQMSAKFQFPIACVRTTRHAAPTSPTGRVAMSEAPPFGRLAHRWGGWWSCDERSVVIRAVGSSVGRLVRWSGGGGARLRASPGRIGTVVAMRIGMFGGSINEGTIDDVVAEARQAEADGFASYWAPNIFGHDALTALAIVGP